jgi:hypothetical protein
MALVNLAVFFVSQPRLAMLAVMLTSIALAARN